MSIFDWLHEPQPQFEVRKHVPPRPDLIAQAQEAMRAAHAHPPTGRDASMVYAQCLLLEDIARSLRREA